MLKFNNGNGALICDKCLIIIKEPYDTRIPQPDKVLCTKCLGKKLCKSCDFNSICKLKKNMLINDKCSFYLSIRKK